MGRKRPILRGSTAVLAAALVLAGVMPSATATPGRPTPTPISRPGGLLPDGASATTGDCELAGVTCRPAVGGSCTGYSSQTTPPATIRVLVRTSDTTVQIETINFETYVENVLPNEWVPSWDGDALKAGAVAVKSYAWYWTTHYGGYTGSTRNTSTCFDVTDDTDFQVYKQGSALARTTAVVEETWPVAARVGGNILQTSYRAYLDSSSEGCGQGADGLTLSQYGTQACNQVNNANNGYRYNVILGKYYYPDLQLATAQQLRTQHDFQFQQTSTRATFHNGAWVIDDGYRTTMTFGRSGDKPVITTAGDGFARLSVFRPSNVTWYVASPTGGVASRTPFGAATDVPVPAQYNGVHRPTVIAVFRPSNDTWYLANPNGTVARRILWGEKGDIPVPGHYAGSAANDYADGAAVFRPSTGVWYIAGHPSVIWGRRGDIPVPADYDGNGTTDIAVYRPSTHRFYVRGQASVEYGIAGDRPVTGDFTGDGRADLAVFRPSTHAWYVRGSATRVFGATGVTPIGLAPYAD